LKLAELIFARAENAGRIGIEFCDFNDGR